MDQFEEIRNNLKQRLKFESSRIDADIASHEQTLLQLRANREILPNQILRASKKLTDKSCCPYCWIIDGTHIRLRSLNGGRDYDLFRCEQCMTEIEVRF